MKTIFTALLIIANVVVAAEKDGGIAQMLKSTDRVVWMGIDYSLMRMIGTTNIIKVPDLLFQGMPAKWNDLFLDERIEGVSGSLNKRIDIDIAGVTERNKLLTPKQMILDNQTKDAITESHITPKDIADLIQSLKPSHKSGLGLMFLVDRIVRERKLVAMPGKLQGNSAPVYISNAEAVYVVFFDLSSREVISSKREVKHVGTGGSFRNFWFGPIKDIDSELSQYRD